MVRHQGPLSPCRRAPAPQPRRSPPSPVTSSTLGLGRLQRASTVLRCVRVQGINGVRASAWVARNQAGTRVRSGPRAQARGSRGDQPGVHAAAGCMLRRRAWGPTGSNQMRALGQPRQPPSAQPGPMKPAARPSMQAGRWHLVTGAGIGPLSTAPDAPVALSCSSPCSQQPVSRQGGSVTMRRHPCTSPLASCLLPLAARRLPLAPTALPHRSVAREQVKPRAVPATMQTYPGRRSACQA